MPGMKLPPPNVRAWYSYAFASEVFAACAIAIFLPITLEHMAREVGFLAPDFEAPCAGLPQADTVHGTSCKAHVLGLWLDTASYSMYVKSIAVIAQALCIISIGPLADSPYWRKRVLIQFAYLGALSGVLFVILPPASSITLLLAALLTVVGNVSYAITIVCANAFLPLLAREDPDVVAAATASELFSTIDDDDVGETEQLLPEAVPVVQAISSQDLAGSSNDERGSEHHSTLLSLTTSRISATGTALGFFSGVVVLALLIIPVTLMKGTTAALRLTITISGVWWAVFTIPAWIGLPQGPKEPRDGKSSSIMGWKRVGAMVGRSEVKRLPNLFTFLLAWIFLSDGFHTTTYTAILYASSTLHMSASKIILIGILVQMAAVLSSVCCPILQRKLGFTNIRLLLWVVLLAQILPVYACLGLILPFGGLRSEGEMYIAATWFGLLYGPFNSYSRAVYAELIPPGHESSFFSLFSLTDKSASFLGPAIVGVIADTTGNIRYGFLFLLFLLAIPVQILIRVRVDAGAEQARLWADSRKVSRYPVQPCAMRDDP